MKLLFSFLKKNFVCFLLAFSFLLSFCLFSLLSTIWYQFNAQTDENMLLGNGNLETYEEESLTSEQETENVAFVEDFEEEALLTSDFDYPLISLGDMTPLTTVEGLSCSSTLCYNLTENCLISVSGDLDTPLYPASTTKLLTCLYALYVLDDDLDTVFTVGEELKLVSYGSSVAGITEGEIWTAEMLLEGMLIPSGNDAAYVMAAGCGRILADDPALDGKTAVEIFVEGMNSFGEAIGLTGTHFTCPDGFHDDDHYTTLHDMLLVALYCLQKEQITSIVKMPSAAVTSLDGVRHVWINTNRLIRKKSGYYQDYVMGLKTGHTNQAGYCLVAAGEKNGNLVITLVYGGSSADRYNDTITLFDTAFSFTEETIAWDS
jgi:D-alanyl-D-alanine carboxypeptidase (penicillin-binding protein 5/6)